MWQTESGQTLSDPSTKHLENIFKSQHSLCAVHVWEKRGSEVRLRGVSSCVQYGLYMGLGIELCTSGKGRLFSPPFHV